MWSTRNRFVGAVWTFVFTCCVFLLPRLSHAELKVITTTTDLAALAREVGGGDVSVNALASASQDPHYVDPRPSQIVALSRADLLVANGLGLEVGWLPQLIVNSRNANVQTGAAGYLDASTAVSRRLGVPSGAVDRSKGDVHPEGNPHYHLDPRAMAQVARVLGAKMSQLDPSNATNYQIRASKTANQLEALATQVASRFHALADAQRQVVAYHQSLTYLFDWLKIDCPIQIEPRPGIPPNPQHVAKVLKTMKARGIKVVIQESYFPKNTSQTVTRMTGASLVIVAGGASKGQSYVARLKKVTDDLYGAISR